MSIMMVSHPIDLEIEDVYWVPQCPMNVLATACMLSKISVNTPDHAEMSCTCRGSQIRRMVGLAYAPRRWTMMVTLSLCSIWERVDLS